MVAPHSPPVFLDIVEEHFDELDFLWEQREANVFSPDWTLKDLAEHEARAFAHLEGVLLGGEAAFALARERLGGGERSAATAATFVLLESEAEEDREAVLGALRSGDQAVIDGARIALRHRSIDALLNPLKELVVGDEPFAAAAAADVLGFHRQQVPGLRQLLEAEEPWCRRMALGAAGRTGVLVEADLVAALGHEEPGVRRVALEEAARCGVPSLHGICRKAATRAGDPDPEAIAFLGVLGDPEDLSTLAAAVRQPDLALQALRGIGVMGCVEAVPLLLASMSDASAAVAAGHAYSRITGASDDALESPATGVEDSDESSGDVAPPDPSRAAADWRDRGARMPAERSWQEGSAADRGLETWMLDRGRRLDVRADMARRCWLRDGAPPTNTELESLARPARA